MKRTRIRLTESDLHRIIKESVKRVINEISDETVARAAGKAGYLSDNGGYAGKPQEYRDRKNRQARYFHDEMDRRSRENFKKVQQEPDSGFWYDDPKLKQRKYRDRMDQQYGQGRREAGAFRN